MRQNERTSSIGPAGIMASWAVWGGGEVRTTKETGNAGEEKGLS